MPYRRHDTMHLRCTPQPNSNLRYDQMDLNAFMTLVSEEPDAVYDAETDAEKIEIPYSEL